MRGTVRTVWVIALLGVVSCTQSPVVNRPVPGYLLDIPVGLIEPDIPRDNQLSPERIALGRRIFFDPRLSATRRVSCATCHDPARAYTEARSVSVTAHGRTLARNAPSVMNSGYLTTFGWDGRFLSLEAQAVAPFHVDSDMGIEIGEAIGRIAADAEYRRQFEVAYHGAPTVATFAKAVASFQRSLISGNSRFDRFLYGGETTVLTELEVAGMYVFLDRAACVNCHDVFHPLVNPLGGAIAPFSDHRFHNLGVGYRAGRMRDLGRYMVTNDWTDWGAFKTPGLRNVALTAPYMHDGSLATLEDVVEFYDRGGIPNPNLSTRMRPLLLLPEQKTALVAFLKTLTDPRLDATVK